MNRTKKQLKQRRKQNAERQRAIRRARDKKKRCRTCGQPAAVSERTGRVTRQCAIHLGMDVARKEVYVLPLQSIEAAERRKFELEYPLSGAQL